MKPKLFVSMLWVLILGLTFIQVRGCVKSEYEFEKKYSYAWNLAEKSSTIEAKCNYISEFVSLISSNSYDFYPYNAIWLQTRDNNFEYNLKAITTLRDRLNEIKGMDTSSFQYNTAIQQITAQEQGEADSLINVIKECYVLQNYRYVWGWIGALITLFIAILWACGFLGLFYIFGDTDAW